MFDVGGEYDVARGRYDHHMRDLPRRPDGTPYSSVGLIWRDFGRSALPRLTPGIDEDMLDSVWQDIDTNFILAIDQADNGVATVGQSSSFAAGRSIQPCLGQRANPMMPPSWRPPISQGESCSAPAARPMPKREPSRSC